MERNRRGFLQTIAAGALFPWHARSVSADDPPRRPRVAMITTVCFFRSHAFNFLENLLRPLLFNGKLIQPPVELVSLYADQTAANGDLTNDIVRQSKLTHGKRVEDALTLGGKNLAVDGVLLIGEHGRDPVNDLGQTEYPRKRLFDQILAGMRR